MGRIKAPGRLWQKPRLATSPSFASVLKRCADRIAIVAIDEAKPGFHVLGYPFHDIGILEFSLGYWGLGFRGFGFRVLGFGVSLGVSGCRLAMPAVVVPCCGPVLCWQRCQDSVVCLLGGRSPSEKILEETKGTLRNSVRLLSFWVFQSVGYAS